MVCCCIVMFVIISRIWSSMVVVFWMIGLSVSFMVVICIGV